jgi:hypothetical protein
LQVQGSGLPGDSLVRCGRNAFDDFVAKTQARLTPEDGTDKGDQYVFLAIAGAAKATLSYRAGKRIQRHALGRQAASLRTSR